MNRVFISALMCVTFFLCMHRPAMAVIEFCPATLVYDSVGQPPSAKSSVYGFALTALRPRTVTSATLTFDTSDGWYTLDVPGVALIRKARHYSAPNASFVRYDYISPILYARFPRPITVSRAWVSSASTQGDSTPGTQRLSKLLRAASHFKTARSYRRPRRSIRTECVTTAFLVA
jgi:hypothetical protein